MTTSFWETPDAGARLWRALRTTLSISIKGVGDVDELLHVAFLAPSSDPVARLRMELLEPAQARTDRGLFDVAVAARAAGREDWLRATIAADLCSDRAWVRARGQVLSGFVGGGGGLEVAAWPEGEVLTDAGQRRVDAARARAAEDAARFWWRRYLAAGDAATAYAAWVLFALAADRRAEIWMDDDVEAHRDDGELSRSKQAHLAFNERALKRDDKRERRLGEHFLGRRIVAGVGPWRDQA